MQILEEDTRNKQYENYLTTHISNVKRAWEDYLKPNLLDADLINRCQELIDSHDLSKYDKEEWEGYLDYFYPGSGKSQKEIDKNFKYSWLHHQHSNPHHWQYWILKEDDVENPEVLDMPLEHIICMLADWHSFRYVDSSKSTLDWYNENKQNMWLSENTESQIDEYIQYLQTPNN